MGAGGDQPPAVHPEPGAVSLRAVGPTRDGGEAGAADALEEVMKDPLHGRGTCKGERTLYRASPAVLQRWLVEPSAFLEDFVVVRDRGFETART